MARTRKAATPTMNDAAQKITGMKTVSPTLDLGNGVTVAAGETLMSATQAALDDYNAALAVADEKLNIFTEAEKELRAFNSKVLPAVGLKYGKDSSEYEKVGGVRDSERKKPVRKPKNS